MAYVLGTGLMRRLKGMMLKNMHGMITCKEFEDFMLDYLDGELPQRQRQRFEWHLLVCRECREYLAAYERAKSVCRKVLLEPGDPVPGDVPGDVPEDLVRAILDSRKQ